MRVARDMAALDNPRQGLAPGVADHAGGPHAALTVENLDGFTLLDPRHRQVTMPYPVGVYFMGAFENYQNPPFREITTAGAGATSGPLSPTRWEAIGPNFRACDACTESPRITILMLTPPTPRGELIPLAERTQDWPVKFH